MDKDSQEEDRNSSNIPLLKPAIAIMEKFKADEDAAKWETLFPRVSNQEVNRALKLIGEICEIKKRLTFHLARHTFATTVTLLKGIDIRVLLPPGIEYKDEFIKFVPRPIMLLARAIVLHFQLYFIQGSALEIVVENQNGAFQYRSLRLWRYYVH